MHPLRSLLTSLLVVSGFSLFVGCGGSSSPDDGLAGGGSPGEGGGGSPGEGGGANDTGGTGGGSTATGCPDAPPADGSACTPPWEPTDSTFGETVVAHCSWGDDPRPGCRTTARCQDGVWEVSAAETAACGDLLPAGCFPSPPDAATACADTATSCWYDDGTRCWCSECAGGSEYPVCQLVDPPEWACAGPSATCPYPLPQAGSACTDEGTNCGLDCGAPIRCQDGRWQWLLCPSCCPICAAPDTPVATLHGERPIASLRVGDLVYSVDDGAIRAVPVLRVGHTRVHAHHVMQLVLEDGRRLEVSPGHPTADGRTLGELGPGSLLDEQHRVVEATLVPYRHAATYDILPASSTGTYFAAGALIGSTLHQPRASD